MIQHHTNTSPLLIAQREIDVNLARVAATKAAVPVAQVSNSQEAPSTNISRKISRAQHLLLKSMENEQCECEMLPRILQILLGLETFVYDQSAPEQVKHGQSAERLHHRNLIVYALQAESVLTSLKTHLAEIMSLKNVRGMSFKRRDKNSCARAAVASFCKLGVCYLSMLDRLNSDKRSIPLEGETKSQYFYGRSRIKRAKKTLEEMQEKYQGILDAKKLTHQDIKMALFDFAHKPKFLAGLADFFKVTKYSLLRVKVNHFVRLLQQGISITSSIDDEKKQATSTRLPCLQVQLAEIPSEFEFRAKRQPAPVSFWRAFIKAESEIEHRQKFLEFILTDWSVHYFYDVRLTNQLVKARSKNNPNFNKECAVLLERCLQKKIVNHAAGIIMHALRVKSKQNELEQATRNKLTKQEIVSIQYDQTNSLYQLKTIISKDYRENLLKYNEMKAKLASTAGFSVQEKNELVVAKKNLGQSAIKRQKNTDFTPCFTFPYLNQILHLLRENTNLTDSDVVSVAAYFLEKEREQPSFTADQWVRGSKRLQISRQKLDGPPAKIKVKQSAKPLSVIEQQASSQRIEFLNENKIKQMTKEEIDMEKDMIPLLGEAAPIERALLKELSEIPLVLEMTPNLRFLLPSTELANTHSSPVNFATGAQFEHTARQQAKAKTDQSN